MNGMPGERPTFTPQQREDLNAAIKGAYRGVINSDEPIILDSLIEKIEKFSQTIMEMDFSNSSKITKSRVLQGYGVSPILLGELENANRASSTVAEEIFVYNKVNPLIELLSGALTQWLAPMFSGERERLVCWIEAAQPHDAENTLKQWDLGLRFGAATRNEYRRSVLNLQDMPGGDVPLEPAGFLPQESDETPDDATGKRGKVRHRKSDDECDDVEDGVCPACGGELNDDDVCKQCGEDWSDCEKGHVNRNGHTNRLAITAKFDAAQPRDEQGRWATEGGGSSDQIKYPHLAHLMNGQRVESAGHSKEDAYARATKLRVGVVYASVLHDPKATRGADYMVMVPAE